MSPKVRRHIASAALIIGFFVLWEVLCAGLGVRDIVLPRPSQIIYTLFARRRVPGEISTPEAPELSEAAVTPVH